jgi:hypothetical protein
LEAESNYKNPNQFYNSKHHTNALACRKQNLAEIYLSEYFAILPNSKGILAEIYKLISFSLGYRLF